MYLTLCYPSTSAKTFIFDLGGVLIETDKRVSFQHLGMINLATYSFRHRINPLHLDAHIKKALFATLHSIAQEHNMSNEHIHLTYDEKGDQLPLLMCTWLQGIMTSTEIRTLIHNSISAHPEWFKCSAEQRLVQNLLLMIFTPEHFINSRKVSAAGIAFIKKCKKEGHKVYALSNWDSESFALLKEKHSQLFDLFDGIIISGHIKANKPHNTIYEALLTQYALNPQDCWFIDDQKENIAAAQQLGINAVMHVSCFKKLITNIRLAHSKSVTRRENLSNNGINETNISTTNKAIIDGEKISLTDSTEYNCPPAKA